MATVNELEAEVARLKAELEVLMKALRAAAEALNSAQFNADGISEAAHQSCWDANLILAGFKK